MQHESLDLRRYLEIILNWWWLILLGPILGGVLSFLLLSRQTPIYEANATILVQQTQNVAFPTIWDFQTSQQLATTYQKLVTTRPILQMAAKELHGLGHRGDLGAKVSATVIPKTSLLQISTQSTNPTQAALAANTLTQVFMDVTRDTKVAEIARLQATAHAQGLPASQNLLDAQMGALGSMVVVEPAVIPSAPISSQSTLKITIAILLGGLLALGVAYLLEYFNDKVRTLERLERLLGLAPLGLVPRWKAKTYSDTPVMTRDNPHSEFAEIFRQIRASLQFALATHTTKSAVVTSPHASEGKSTIVVNLGAAQAMSGVKVILVDADLRRPSLHRFFKISNDIGLSTLLANHDLLPENVLKPTDIDGLSIMASGPIPPNPAELLESPRMRMLVDKLTSSADLVLYDSPPTLILADTMVLAAQVGKVILVADAHNTRVNTMKSAMDIFQRAECSTVGAILNKANLKRTQHGYGAYLYPQNQNTPDEHEHRPGDGHNWRQRVRRLLNR